MNQPIPPIAPIGTQTSAALAVNNDEEQLKLLAIFHYVVGGLAAVFALFPIIHLVMGLVFVLAVPPLTVQGQPSQPNPAIIGWFFIILAGVFITLGLTMASLILMAGRSLSGRKRYNFCLVMACVECVFMPFGTALGIFTIIVLNRPSVKQLFGVGAAPAGVNYSGKI